MLRCEECRRILDPHPRLGPVTAGRRLVVETDGGSRGNPGPAGYGAVVRDAATGAVLAEVAEAIGIVTNNVAEYQGLIAGLRAAAQIDPTAHVEVRADSKLVVEQMSGRWQIKHEGMRRLVAQAREVLPVAHVRYTWVPRAKNTHADRLANEAMDAAAAGGRGSSARHPADQAVGGAGVEESGVGGSGRSGRRRRGGIGACPAPGGRRPDDAAADPARAHAADRGGPVLRPRRRGSGAVGRRRSRTPRGWPRWWHGWARRGQCWPTSPAPVAVVCSPMQRTRQTAAVVAARLGLTVADRRRVDRGRLRRLGGPDLRRDRPSGTRRS